MSFNRGRWLINTVLVLALFAFLGFFTLPLLASFLDDNQVAKGVTSGSNQTVFSATQSQLEQQAKGYELVLQREADNRTALRGLLDVRLQLGDLKGAIAVLEKLAKLNPDQSDYMVLLAQAKQQTGDPEGAAEAYRTVLAAKPGDMNALQGIVSLQLQQKRPEAAIGLLQDTLKTANQANQIQPGSIDTSSIQLLLGQVYVNEQRYTEALTIYDESIKVNRDDFRPVLAKALVLKQQGKVTDAKPLFTTAVSLAPSEFKDQIKQMALTLPTPSSSPSIAPNPKSSAVSEPTIPTPKVVSPATPSSVPQASPNVN